MIAESLEEEALVFDMYVKKVKAIVCYVKEDQRFDEIHLQGHSEGTLIMKVAAQQNGDVVSLVSIASIGRPVMKH